MGGSVSSGRDNDELVDNLVNGNFIRSRTVERAFRALHRQDYMTGDLDRAYKDLAWRSGPLHLSAPCIYSEVMEGLELKPGLTFLNIGSGTGYFSTMVGLILGSSGISHGVEVNEVALNYANEKLAQFQDSSYALAEFDFCEPKFYLGNGLCISDLPVQYDRVYCGAGCPESEKYQSYFKQLIKVGGIVVIPVEDKLIQLRRISENEWVKKSLLNVSFAPLSIPTEEFEATLKLEEQAPPRLLLLARAAIRRAVRSRVFGHSPDLQDPICRPPPKHSPRRICIPIDEYRYFERFTALHGLDSEGGAHEVNSLLSLVLNLGNHGRELSAYDLGSESDVSSYLGEEEVVDVDGIEDPPNLDDQNNEVSESSGDDGDDGNDGDDGTGSGACRRRNFACHVLFNRPAPSSTVANSGASTNSSNDLEEFDMVWDSDTEDSVQSEGKRIRGRQKKPKQLKRQKLDSGIGEDNTPSSEGTPHSSPDTSDRSNTVVDPPTDTGNELTQRKKRPSRESRGSRGSSSSERETRPASETPPRLPPRPPLKRRATDRRADAPDRYAVARSLRERRARLSGEVERAVMQLPLPSMLKKYVNLGRTPASVYID